MDTHTPETYRTIRGTATPLLLAVRNHQCSYIGSPDDPRPDPFRGRTLNGGGLVLNESGRIEGMPSTNRTSGARGEFSGIDEADPFADWQNAEPVVYPDCIEHSCCKAAYLLGRSDRLLESIAAQDAVIERTIELASR